jgi:epoxyqueuosine reductase
MTESKETRNGQNDDHKKALLVHVCCGPCFIAPYEMLKEEGEYNITGFWFNHNIHPFLEYQQRMSTLRDWAERESVSLIISEEYQPEQFMRQVSGREQERCFLCYWYRLQKAAMKAKSEGCDAFTTTLLYSKYQQHELIKRIGERLSQVHEIDFMYRDFRSLWGRGIKLSRKAEMYRQQYCGCLYSEHDRYRQR